MIPAVRQGPLWQFPEKALFGRNIPKTKFYEKAEVKNALRQLFVAQVEQIVWQYKLATETVNLPSGASVLEIQVFTVLLKTGKLDFDVLAAIDSVVPSPILFELRYQGKTRLVAAYKRAHRQDPSRHVVSDYFASDWIADDGARSTLPVVLDMDGLYQQLLYRLIPLAPRLQESMDELVERTRMAYSKQREIGQAENQLAREKQFKHKLGINARLRALRQELEQICH